MMSLVLPAAEQDGWQRGKSEGITFRESPLEAGVTRDAERLLAGSWKEKTPQDKYGARWARGPSGRPAQEAASSRGRDDIFM